MTWLNRLCLAFSALFFLAHFALAWLLVWWFVLAAPTTQQFFR